MDFLQRILYELLYLFSYIEIFYKTYILPYISSGECCEDNENELIVLINTVTGKKQVIHEYKELDEQEVISFDYEFGIVAKNIEGKASHYIFNDLDTDDIPDMFNEPIERPFFSCDLRIVTTNESYSIDITDIDYFFHGNTIFFKNHLKHILSDKNGIDLSDLEYELTLINSNCMPVIVSPTQHIVIDNACEDKYKVSGN